MSHHLTIWSLYKNNRYLCTDKCPTSLRLLAANILMVRQFDNVWRHIWTRMEHLSWMQTYCYYSFIRDIWCMVAWFAGYSLKLLSLRIVTIQHAAIIFIKKILKDLTRKRFPYWHPSWVSDARIVSKSISISKSTMTLIYADVESRNLRFCPLRTKLRLRSLNNKTIAEVL